jgi:hypothetical protein
MFVKLFILTLLCLAIAALGFGIRMLLKPDSHFPETHVSRNPEMKKRGITCAQDINLGCHPSDSGCTACGRRF